MTLAEMAKELNVSPSTVSRVLNGYNKNFGVKPAMRAQILALAEKTGYRPNPVFRAIRAHENKQIAFSFYSYSMLRNGDTLDRALDEATKALDANGYTFHYLFHPRGRRECYPMPEWPVAGMIIPDVIDPVLLQTIENRKCPYVVLNGVSGENGTAVMSDETANIRLTMDYLYQLGHRKIGYINCPPVNERHHSILDRENGYVQFMKTHCGTPLEGYESSPVPVPAQFDRLIEQGATAIVTFQPEAAIIVLETAWRRGVAVPKEISVMTFNDSWHARHTIPPLTCCDIAAEEMGRETARLILDKVSGSQKEHTGICRFPGQLRERESTAPPSPIA